MVLKTSGCGMGVKVVGLLVSQPGGPCLEACWILEISCGSSAVEQALAVELPESIEELLAEHGAQHWNGQQE